MHERVIMAAAAALALAAPLPAPARDKAPAYADPADVITAEIAFARLAKDKGQWSAYRKTMARGAEMFVPQRVAAAAWLNGRKDPPQPASCAPGEVWMSCDGSAALATGSWHQGAEQQGGHGWFASIWQRQKNGRYLWLLRDGDRDNAAASATKDDDIATISAHLADCPKGKTRDADKAGIAAWAAKTRATAGVTTAASTDGTLHWEVGAEPDGAHNLSVWAWKDGAMSQVHISEVSAPTPAAPR